MTTHDSDNSLYTELRNVNHYNEVGASLEGLQKALEVLELHERQIVSAEDNILRPTEGNQFLFTAIGDRHPRKVGRLLMDSCFGPHDGISYADETRTLAPGEEIRADHIQAGTGGLWAVTGGECLEITDLDAIEMHMEEVPKAEA